MKREQFIASLADLKNSATFLTLSQYTNEAKEVADYSIIFNISYKNALKRSINALTKIETTSPLQELAKQQLIKSYLNSLEDVDNVGPGYDKVKNTYGEYIKGLKRHVESDILYLFGFINFKRVIVPGSYKTRVRQDLTIAKDELRKNLPVSRFRQFILSPNTLKYITVRGCKLDPPE